jgi:hypothetical protein
MGGLLLPAAASLVKTALSGTGLADGEFSHFLGKSQTESEFLFCFRNKRAH